MSIDYKILLNSAKNIKSVNTDFSVKLELSKTEKPLAESEFNTFVNSADVFNSERESNNTYRIYGSFDFVSILNGIKLDLNSSFLSDYFIKEESSPKTIFNSFKFYLLKPKGFSTYTGSTENMYVREFDILAYPNDFDIYNAGFAKNVFNDQTYIFIIKKNIDINGSNGYERNNIPITELYIYAEYIPSVNESMSNIQWTTSGNTIISTGSTSVISMTDCCLLDMANYNQTIYQTQTNSIKTPFLSGNQSFSIQYSLTWKYNPFIPLKTRILSDELFKVYSGDTSYDLVNSIPEYAYDSGGGNYIWRTIMSQDYINPITFETLNYPFISGCRYLFNHTILSINTDLSDPITFGQFQNMVYNSQTINYAPSSDINNIGKPCL